MPRYEMRDLRVSGPAPLLLPAGRGPLPGRARYRELAPERMDAALSPALGGPLSLLWREEAEAT